jgi:Flp pilus assembly protein TadG
MKRTGNARRRRQKGAEILEAALIIVPLFGILFLTLDVGMVIFVRSTFQHAVREGVRYAITGQTQGALCHDASVKNIVKANAVGLLNNATAASKIHVHWINPVTGAVADNSYGNIVEVSVEGFQYKALAPYQRLNSNPLVWARAYDMMEEIPGSLPCITTLE